MVDRPPCASPKCKGPSSGTPRCFSDLGKGTEVIDADMGPVRRCLLEIRCSTKRWNRSWTDADSDVFFVPTNTLPIPYQYPTNTLPIPYQIGMECQVWRLDHVGLIIYRIDKGAPPALTPGAAFAFQVSVSCALSTREQMYSCFRVLVAFNPFPWFLFQSFSSS